jgi:hypothetical protein
MTAEATELAALARIAEAVENHDVSALVEALQDERANLRSDGRALSQLNNLITVLTLAPAAFRREHDKLDAVLNPPEPPTMPGG